MKFTVDRKLLIDDVYLCNFMYHSGSEEFMSSCETMLKTVCMLYENQKNQTRERDDDLLTHRLNSFKQELLDSMSHQKIDTVDLMTSLRTMNDHQTLTLSSRLEQIPQLTSKMDDLRVNISSKIDTVREKIDMTKVVETRTTDSLVHAMNTVSDQVSSMTSKIETFSSSRNTTRFKGEEGERGLHEVLENNLPSRDGYQIIDTKSVPHSCDMVIHRVGYPDVRIESKAHGRDTGESVRTQEVNRFESDLIHLNSHGIFVSLYSGICGKGAFEFEYLPSIKKFAFYISRNEFDGGMIAEIVRLVYKLDTFVSDKDEDEMMSITHESIVKIKMHLNDFNRKIDDLKTNSKNSLRILNEITLDVIEKLFINNEPDKKIFECIKCKHPCKNKSGLTLHLKKCSVG
jgi:hypothetical protein